jgi:hypothetical protein
MTIKLGVTLAVLTLVTSGTGCGKQKPESGTADVTKDSTSVAVVGDTAAKEEPAVGPGACRIPCGGQDGCCQR